MKEKLIAVYNNHLPSKLEKLFYDHWGSKSIKSTKSYYTIYMVALFMLQMILLAIDEEYILRIIVLIFFASLIVLVIPWIIIWYIHRSRIKAIAAELDITVKEWNRLVKVHSLDL